MTNTELTGYTILIEQNFSTLIQTWIKYIQVGKVMNISSVRELIVLDYLIEMIQDYHLFSDDEFNYNHLTSDEMKDIAFYINKLLKTNYNPDFKLN